ncbi:MAG: PEGA domain-containing protein, partial [ANME-2 cluster archaeon]
MVTVNASETTDIFLELSIKKNFIYASSNPVRASVYLDGIYKGTTPIRIPDVPVGDHKIRLVLKKFGYTDFSQSIVIQADQETVVNTT